MQALGNYEGWDVPSIVIQVSPAEVNDLFLALNCLDQLSNGQNVRGKAWQKLMNELNGENFGFSETTSKTY